MENISFSGSNRTINRSFPETTPITSVGSTESDKNSVDTNKNDPTRIPSSVAAGTAAFSSSWTTSSAETLVRKVGKRIGMDYNSDEMKLIFDNLQKEYIKYEWQLSELDSFQWQSIGAPIGLATAVRTLVKLSESAKNAAMAAAQQDSLAAPHSVVSHPGFNRSSTTTAAPINHNFHSRTSTFSSSSPPAFTSFTGGGGVPNNHNNNNNNNRSSLIGPARTSRNVSAGMDHPLPSVVKSGPSLSEDSRQSLNLRMSSPWLSPNIRKDPDTENKDKNKSTNTNDHQQKDKNVVRFSTASMASLPVAPPARKGSVSLSPPISEVAVVDEESGSATRRIASRSNTQPITGQTSGSNRSDDKKDGLQPTATGGTSSLKSCEVDRHSTVKNAKKGFSKISTAPHCSKSFGRSLQEYVQHSKDAVADEDSSSLIQRIIFFTGRSFPLTSKFQRALIHSKVGADLKAHSVFLMELNVLAAALLFGAGIELWGLFPMDLVGDKPDDPTQPFIPRNLALVFHFFNCTSLIVQLICTVGWIWSLYATAAVSSTKFHMFRIQTRYVFDQFLVFTEFGQLLFAVNIGALLGAQVAATTKNPLIRKFGYTIPMVLIVCGYRFIQRLSSYIGRVAYHGLLLMDDDVNENLLLQLGVGSGVCHKKRSRRSRRRRNQGRGQDNDIDNIADMAEQDVAKVFAQQNIVCEKSVLNVYHKATTQSYEVHQDEQPGEEDDDPNILRTDEYYSLLDIIFPNIDDAPPPSGTATTMMTSSKMKENKDRENLMESNDIQRHLIALR